MLRGHQLSGTRRLNGHYQSEGQKEQWGWIVKVRFNTNFVNSPGSTPDRRQTMIDDIASVPTDLIKDSPWTNLNNDIWLKFKIEMPAGYGVLVDARQLYAVGSGYPSFLDAKTIYYPAYDNSTYGPGRYGRPISGEFSFTDWSAEYGQEWGFYRVNMTWPVVLKNSTLTPYTFNTYNRYLTNNIVEFYAYIPANYYSTIQNSLKSLKISNVAIIGSPSQTSERVEAIVSMRYATDAEVQRDGMIV